jgi:uncharacterized GH25 family protein
MRTIELALTCGLLLTPLFAAAAASRPASTKPTKPLVVQVLDAESGKPLAGAVVILRREGDYKDPIPANDHGKATVRPEADASYVAVLCRREGYVSTGAYWLNRDEKPVDLPAELAMRLAKGKHIAGRVIDEAGKPVAKAKVILDYRVDADESKQPAVAQRIAEETLATDAEGKWSYDGSPADPSRIEIRVDHPDFIHDGRIDPYPTKEQLLTGTAVIRLEKGVDVSGTVTSTDGKPIAKAKVSTVQTTWVVNDYGSKKTTDAQGRFELTHLRPGVTPITVTAKGFAPDIIKADVKAGMTPVDFKLSPGQPLRGRIIDRQGKPIAGAFVHLDGWRNMGSLSFSGKTDADGRFTMPDAPPDAMEFQISKQGYRDKVRQIITRPADGSEAVVTLDPEIKISGTVVDAETKKPIEKFRVITGYALWEGHPPSFSFERAKPFTDGRYAYTSDAHEQVIACYVRIEAEGYTPAVSPPIRGGGGTFDAQLHRGCNVSGIVTTPDGKPLADAAVVLSPAGAQLDIWDQKVQRDDVLKSKTDAGGRFTFPPQTGDIWFVVIADAGHAFVKGDSSGADGKNDIRLSAWSRITGQYAPGGTPVKDKSLDALCDPVREPRDIAPRPIWRLRGGKTDADGRFHFDKVPNFGGGPCVLMIGRSEIRSFDERRWIPLQLKPGKTVEVNVAGGCTVAGRVAPASEAQRIKGEGFILVKPIAPKPASAWPLDIFAAAAQAQPVCRDSINPDGSFVVPCLSPGSYEYELMMYAGDAYGGASGNFEVPADSTEAQIGSIQYQRTDALKLGEAAPDILGRTFDDQPIRAADYAGKFIVLAIWDSCTGRSDEHIPYLNQAAEALAGNEKITLISVNLDAVSCGMSGIPRRPHTLDNSAWVKGYIPMADNSLCSRIGGKKWPAIVIFSPDGKLVARDLDGKDVVGKVKEVMGAKSE